MHRSIGIVLLLLAIAPGTSAEEKPLPQDWDYEMAMKKVAGRFKARPGVVLHVGDSITYGNTYGAWARGGQGKTDADKLVLSWMHSSKEDDTDGWHLARFDHPDGGRSFTACSGLRADELLAGGRRKMPSLSQLLDTYKPQMAVLPARMLISVAPAGLEQMFFECGIPLAQGAATAPPPTKDEIEKLMKIAPRYGIEIRLPKQ